MRSSSSIRPLWAWPTALFVLCASLLGGCAHRRAPSAPSDKSQPSLTGSGAELRYQQGLARYTGSQYEPALEDLQAAVASGKLRSANMINARKHMAFIYCVTNRQLLCREQFQAILQLDPNFILAANEANHPQWGAVWSSLKGAADDAKAVSRGSAILASKGQEKLAEGIREYTAGNYKEAASALQAALASGLPDKADQIRAHKYAAFAYCLTKRSAQCQAEFSAIFLLDPAFELLPSEAGHPAWRNAYRKGLAAARKSVKK